jgi:hypothetical protein
MLRVNSLSPDAECCWENLEAGTPFMVSNGMEGRENQ